jgi:hypothetical protein
VLRVLDRYPRACLAVAMAASLGCDDTPTQTVIRFGASPDLVVPEGATISIEVWGDGVRQHEPGQLRGPFPFTPDIKLVVDARATTPSGGSPCSRSSSTARAHA